MKLPSIQQVLEASGRTFFRFPLVLLNAIAGTAVAVILIDHEGPAVSTILFKVLLAAVLGIPFLTAVTLAAEKGKWGKITVLGALVVALLVLAAYAFTVPFDLDGSPGYHLQRLLMLGAAACFLVAIAPFARRGEVNGFWQYNKSLLLRIVTAGLFSGVLYAGLAVALAALDNLFGIEIIAKRYFELWACVVGVFATWVFLAGVPEDLSALDGLTEYPKILKVFSQYILVPLVLIYLLILYAYVGKILVEWSWPRGWVSGLILGYAATGILLLLLLHPIRERGENSWMRPAALWFWASLVPLVVVLFLAMSRRVGEYGITEGRYVGMAVAGWLAVMVVYFLLSRGKNIKVIPASLFVVALGMAFGPWGAFEVSQGSQVARLRDLLERNSLLVDGKARPARDSVSFADQRQISSIIGYLRDIHGYGAIQPWFDSSLTHDSAWTGTKAKDPSEVTRMLGIDYVAVWEGGGFGSIALNAGRNGIVDVAGYERLVESQYIGGPTLSREFTEDRVAYRVNPALDTLTFIHRPPDAPADSVAVALRPLVDRLLTEYANLGARDIPPGKMVVEAGVPGLKVRVCLKSLQLRRRDDGVTLNSYEAEILYSLGPPK